MGGDLLKFVHGILPKVVVSVEGDLWNSWVIEDKDYSEYRWCSLLITCIPEKAGWSKRFGLSYCLDMTKKFKILLSLQTRGKKQYG